MYCTQACPFCQSAERLLVEAWSEQAPFQPSSYQEPVVPEPVPVEHKTRLRLRVDVAVQHPAGAQWQARALASRVTEAATITAVTQGGDGVSVHLDLGRWPQPPQQVVTDAAEALGRPEWSPMELGPDGTDLDRRHGQATRPDSAAQRRPDRPRRSAVTGKLAHCVGHHFLSRSASP